MSAFRIHIWTPIKWNKMIEVFSTNVCDRPIADLLIYQIEKHFVKYQANFDLEDCDHILRIKSMDAINTLPILDFIRGFGYSIEILPDDEIPKSQFPEFSKVVAYADITD